MALERIKITVLNVGDGDAIIVNLERGKDRLIILVDGGHKGDSAQVIQELDAQLQEAGKSGPDLILCTHCDQDHIGGLEAVVDKYQGNRRGGPS